VETRTESSRTKVILLNGEQGKKNVKKKNSGNGSSISDRVSGWKGNKEFINPWKELTKKKVWNSRPRWMETTEKTSTKPGESYGNRLLGKKETLNKLRRHLGRGSA